ncbi:hypothetical protein KIW84_035358 [Lathyrus oleraceus]|uniref:Retrovirus-related Pol polyprotein from transposon TNT 1-94-like beta-barrel domain-containing protein n=1 Tax=Pisum sativum TaxID=3888 RepID=A0A9D5B0M5_PEA|nr:hypothetical protein KIW84_035358 [Pisum sativum]
MNHVTGRIVWLADFEDSKKSKVKLADNSSLQAEGTGDIVIQMSNVAKAIIKGDATYKPLMGYEVDEESSEHEEIPIDNVPITIGVEAHNREGATSTIQRPQRTIVLPARLQDYEVVGDDEFTTDGKLVYFALLAGAKPINYSEALKNKQ